MVCAMLLENKGNVVHRLESLDLVRGKSDIVVAYLDNHECISESAIPFESQNDC